VFLPDGTINMDSIRGAIDAQAKQRIVHTAQDPREGIKFIQENAKKKNTRYEIIVFIVFNIFSDCLTKIRQKY
jgi:hypothetical protein